MLLQAKCGDDGDSEDGDADDNGDSDFGDDGDRAQGMRRRQ